MSLFLARKIFKWVVFFTEGNYHLEEAIFLRLQLSACVLSVCVCACVCFDSWCVFFSSVGVCVSAVWGPGVILLLSPPEIPN